MRDYRPSHQALSGDVKTMLKNHPDSFDALFYRADLTTPETLAVAPDVVGALDVAERSLSYADPLQTRVMLIPEPAPVLMIWNGTESNATGTPIVLLSTDDDVPVQSVFQWSEYISENESRDVSFYVLYAESVGVAPGVCSKLYCLPMQAFEGLP